MPDKQRKRPIVSPRRRALARAAAYESASMHLDFDWTDDPVEIEEGAKLVKHFERMATLWTWKAMDLPDTVQ